MTPEELAQQADNVRDKISAAQRSFSRISDSISRTDSYWKGDAAEKHRKAFDLLVPVMEDLFTRFSEHANDLRAMSGVYMQVERDVSGQISPLPGDAIQ